jgi:hypothetical protein
MMERTEANSWHFFVTNPIILLLKSDLSMAFQLLFSELELIFHHISTKSFKKYFFKR